MRILLITAALIGLVLTCFFGMREPVSLFFIIPIFLIYFSILSYVESKIRVNKKLSIKEKNVTITVCSVAFLLTSLATNFAELQWVNSLTPIFGNEYLAKEESARIQNAAQKEIQRAENTQALMIYNAEKSIKAKLKDAESAKFSNQKLTNRGAVCGYVNAKNSFGAYSGDTRFIYASDYSSIDDGNDGFSSMWEKFCS